MMFAVLQYVKRDKTKTLCKTSTGNPTLCLDKVGDYFSSASRSRYYVEACVFHICQVFFIPSTCSQKIYV